jgi:hypothetical protein
MLGKEITKIFTGSTGYRESFVLYPFRFYEEVELEKIRGAWGKWRNPANWFGNIKGFNQSEK